MLAWKIQWTEEAGGLQSMVSQSNMTEREHTIILLMMVMVKWGKGRVLIIELRFLFYFIYFILFLELRFLKNFNFNWCIVALQCIIFCSCNTCMLSHFGCVQLCATLWTVACQLSKEFSRWECWSGLNFLLQGIFPTQLLNLPFLTYICIGRRVLYH